MNKLILWLNNNQGFTMFILTLIYVFATIIIVIYNKKSINEIKQSREEENRPYIFANLQKDSRDIGFYLKIKNYGKTGGKLKSITISPSLKFVNDSNIDTFLNNVILAPAQSIQFIILEKSEETSKNNYQVSIKYESTNINNKVYLEDYILITQYESLMGYTNSKRTNLSDAENALVSIAGYLDSIRNKL